LWIHLKIYLAKKVKKIVKAKLVEHINFERGIDPKDAMDIGLPYIRAISKMKPGVVYKSEDGTKWDYSMFFKNPKDNEIYYTFTTSRKVNNAYRFLDKHQKRSFPLNLVPLNKHFDKFIKKLTFTNESVNFERGIDPKTSMGVGRIWGMSKREVAKEIINTCEKELEDFIQTVNAKARMEGFKNSFDYIAKAYNERGDINTLPSVENAIEELTGGIDKILSLYPVKEERERVSSSKTIIGNDITNFFVAGEPPYGTLITQISASLDDRLKESVNFERGIEPKRSMKVGMVKALPKIIEDLLRYDEENGQDILREIRFYKDGVEFACSVDRSELSDKQRVDYVRELIKKFKLDTFIILKPVKFYRPMGIANFIFELTEEGHKVNPKKRFYLHMNGGKFTIEDNKISSFVEDYLYAKTLQEAYNFERGLEPKVSMGVGLEAKFPKLKEFLKIHKSAKNSDCFSEVSDIDYDLAEPKFIIVSKKKTGANKKGYEFEEFTFYLTREDGIVGFADHIDKEYEVIDLAHFQIITKCYDKVSEKLLKKNSNL
jgi:hypothetical protein